jgi:hypothetical protein
MTELCISYSSGNYGYTLEEEIYMVKEAALYNDARVYS